MKTLGNPIWPKGHWQRKLIKVFVVVVVVVVCLFVFFVVDVVCGESLSS